MVSSTRPVLISQLVSVVPEILFPFPAPVCIISISVMCTSCSIRPTILTVEFLPPSLNTRIHAHDCHFAPVDPYPWQDVLFHYALHYDKPSFEPYFYPQLVPEFGESRSDYVPPLIGHVLCTRSHNFYAFLSYHNLCFGSKIRKIVYPCIP